MLPRDDFQSESAQIAAIIEAIGAESATVRLERVLDFFGIRWQRFRDISHLVAATTSGPLGAMRYAVFAPLAALGELRSATQENGRISIAHSVFSYLTDDTDQCSEILRNLTGCVDARLTPLGDERVDANISDSLPAFTGPMHALRCAAKVTPHDRVFLCGNPGVISPIVQGPAGAFSFCFHWGELQTFVSCTSDLPDLSQPLPGRWYDVRDHFLSTVPLVMYLKWAFRDVCWQANEAGACLIIDDPVLKTKYGFCDFRQLDAQMLKHSFTTNIALIPWNWRRTSATMAKLVRSSAGRLSVSVHGCDHTDKEFGSRVIPELAGKAALARQRMERHHGESGIPHDLIMVFPQGVFSTESLGVLQQQQFVAAVNTEALPVNGAETVTIGEAWESAILKYGSFPFFTRRYPSHGLENFAFDLLLGKPCLIVEHHEFFKKNGQKVIKFVDGLNSLNCKLLWRGLGEVIRRCFQWRTGLDGVIQVRMFANELLLRNDTGEQRDYQIQKADRGSVGIQQITVDGQKVEWKTEAHSITFTCSVSPKTEVLIQVRYCSGQEPGETRYQLSTLAKIAVRRYLSEFRDNFLSRHEPLLLAAQKANKFVGRR